VAAKAFIADVPKGNGVDQLVLVIHGEDNRHLSSPIRVWLMLRRFQDANYHFPPYTQRHTTHFQIPWSSTPLLYQFCPPGQVKNPPHLAMLILDLCGKN
jgi:hypothetical protein